MPELIEGAQGSVTYYTLSPYSYVANNPTKFIDPDGRYIDILYKDDDGNEQTHRYGSGDEINNDFVQSVVNTLDALLYNGLDVEGVISTLAFDDNTTNISEIVWDDHNNSLMIGKGGNVGWSPEGGIVTDNGDNRSPAVGLLHELGHIYYDSYNPEGNPNEPNPSDYPVSDEGTKQFINDYYKYEDEMEQRSGSYDNPSDKWIIQNVENPASRKLNQPTRNSHSYKRKYRSEGPFSTKEKSN